MFDSLTQEQIMGPGSPEPHILMCNHFWKKKKKKNSFQKGLKSLLNNFGNLISISCLNTQSDRDLFTLAEGQAQTSLEL